MKIFSYQDLDVWQKAICLAEHAYRLMAKLPGDERFGLTLQIKRAVVSIAANIAEGYGREHVREYIHHLAIAKGSLYETETFLLLCLRLGLLQEAEIQEALHLSDDVRRMLIKLIAALKRSDGIATRNPQPATREAVRHG